MGPVQVLVVGLDRPTFSGEVLEEFDRLRDAGLVRLVDVLLVARAGDGTLESMPLDGSAPDAGAVATALLTEGGAGMDTAPDGDRVWSLGAALPPGTTA